MYPIVFSFFFQNEWEDNNKYPVVPGHEVVGIIKAMGKDVKGLQLGDRVGFGPQRSSCGECEYCLKEEDQACPNFVGLYDPLFGGYATTIQVDYRFAFKIPDSIPSEVAGPLLCAGVTSYSPLAKYAKKGDKVGIIGVGGLGHMGIQYAAAMGCETWAISTSNAKEAEAKTFGATHFLVSTDPEQMAAQKNTFDFILCTASANFKVNDYLKLLKPQKSFCLVGLPAVDQPLTFYPFDVVAGERKIVGSMIGGRKTMRDMLQFSADHKIYPLCQVIPFSDAQAGFDRILANQVRYRMVLKIEGFRETQH
jgi:D-arabinose 1-dehydrogenase-like Zn-dependent alcohol dehydrogenase